jgi:hypothetical protein
MVRFGNKLFREQQGSTIVLMGFSLLLLLTVVGLVIDGGTMYAAKSHLQKTVNAAALSGAQELTGKESDVRAIVGNIITRHGEQASLALTDVKMQSTVRVQLSKKVTLGFSQLLGKKDVTVVVSAAAQLSPMGEATGVFPFGVEDSIPLQKYKTYTLLEGPHGGQTGFYGSLDIGGGGPQGYIDNLAHGYQGEVAVGDIIGTLQGERAGQNIVINERIDSDPYPPGEYWHRDSPRIMLLPLYHDYDHKRVQITGFAYFYLTAPYTKKDKQLIGMFIERTGAGFTKPNAPDKGAFTIRLIE